MRALLPLPVVALLAHPAPAQAGDAALAPPAVRAELLLHLDDAFARGDLDGYAARFTPDQPVLHAAMLQRLRDVFARTTSRARCSTVVGMPHTVGAHTVLHVRHETTLRGNTGAATTSATSRDDEVLVLRRGDDGSFGIVLAVAAGPGGALVDGPFRCPPCNHSIGGVPDFLCVPRPALRNGTLETASFFLLGSDVVADVAVQVDPEARPAAVAAQELADTLRRLEGATPGVVEAWRPAALATAPAGITAARVVQAVGGDREVHSHVVVCGGLQHLVMVRGSADALRTRAAAVDALLASYRLLAPDRDAATAVAAPFEHHTGGVLTGTRYENRHHGVELDGAPGWRPVMLTGGSAFRVVWTSPQGSRLWLTGYTVPPGMERWCTATADRWLDQQCARAGVRLAPQDAACTPWQDEPRGGGALRTVVGEDPGHGAEPLRRWFRLHRRDDLLLIVDGFATTAADEVDLQRMLATMRRR